MPAARTLGVRQCRRAGEDPAPAGVLLPERHRVPGSGHEMISPSWGLPATAASDGAKQHCPRRASGSTALRSTRMSPEAEPSAVALAPRAMKVGLRIASSTPGTEIAGRSPSWCESGCNQRAWSEVWRRTQAGHAGGARRRPSTRPVPEVATLIAGPPPPQRAGRSLPLCLARPSAVRGLHGSPIGSYPVPPDEDRPCVA